MDVRERLRQGESIYDQKLRVCYYARVSTDHELQFTSIVNQVDYFEKYIESVNGWILIGGYVDEGISGKEVRKRENFLKMIEDGRKHKFDLVLTKSVSRFARNTIDSIRYTNLLLSYDIGVMFIHDNINTFYSDSEFRLTLMASIAQDELRKLSESVRFGLRQSIDRGVVLGNNNILGYYKDKGKLVIVEEEAKIVRNIFSLFVQDKYNYKEVGEIIFNCYGKKLDSTGIKRILTNYKYKGYYCGRKSEIIDYKNSRRKWNRRDKWVVYPDYLNVPPIVDENIWDRVQVIINKRRKDKGKKLGNYSYKNKIYCNCHKRFFKCRVKKYKDKVYCYYVCSRCCSLSSELLDRISRVCLFSYMKVIPEEVIKLLVRCKD